MKHWRFKELFYHCTYATLDGGNNADQSDPYWVIGQMVQQFNDHYKNKLDRGWKVMVDEHILWSQARDQPVGGRKVYRKPRGFRPEYKCLSVVEVQVTTTFEHVISKEVNYKSKYTK